MLNWTAAIFERAAYKDLMPTRQILRLQSVIQLSLTGYACPIGVMMENTCWCLTSLAGLLVRLRALSWEIVTTIALPISTCWANKLLCGLFMCWSCSVIHVSFCTFPLSLFDLTTRSLKAASWVPNSLNHFRHFWLARFLGALSNSAICYGWFR